MICQAPPNPCQLNRFSRPLLRRQAGSHQQQWRRLQFCRHTNRPTANRLPWDVDAFWATGRPATELWAQDAIMMDTPVVAVVEALVVLVRTGLATGETPSRMTVTTGKEATTFRRDQDRRDSIEMAAVATQRRRQGTVARTIDPGTRTLDEEAEGSLKTTVPHVSTRHQHRRLAA